MITGETNLKAEVRVFNEIPGVYKTVVTSRNQMCS